MALKSKWIPKSDSDIPQLKSNVIGYENLKMAKLTQTRQKTWNRDVIDKNFTKEYARLIHRLQISLDRKDNLI